MRTVTWREGINEIIEQKETVVHKKELLNSICKELDRKKIGYDIYNTNDSWKIKLL